METSSCFGVSISLFIFYPLAGCLNASYLTDSYIGFTLKMESVTKNTIFGLKMMVKCGLEKIFLKFLHAFSYFIKVPKITNFFRPLFTIIFRPKMVFLVTDSILRVKPMYESVK